MSRICLVLPAVVALVVAPVRAEEPKENPIVTLVKSKVKDKGKPFTLVVAFQVKPGQEAAFEKAFGPALTATRKEPGCLAYQLSRDADHPDTFLMYERFKSVAAIEEHAKQKYVTDLLGTVLPMLAGEPKVKVYTVAGE